MLARLPSDARLLTDEFHANSFFSLWGDEPAKQRAVLSIRLAQSDRRDKTPMD